MYILRKRIAKQPQKSFEICRFHAKANQVRASIEHQVLKWFSFFCANSMECFSARKWRLLCMFAGFRFHRVGSLAALFHARPWPKRQLPWHRSQFGKKPQAQPETTTTQLHHLTHHISHPRQKTNLIFHCQALAIVRNPRFSERILGTCSIVERTFCWRPHKTLTEKKTQYDAKKYVVGQSAQWNVHFRTANRSLGLDEENTDFEVLCVLMIQYSFVQAPGCKQWREAIEALIVKFNNPDVVSAWSCDFRYYWYFWYQIR